jgi:hypothetical protein
MKIPPAVHVLLLLFFLLLDASPCLSQPVSPEIITVDGSGDFFLYVDNFCGKYNSSIQKQELVIQALKFPAYLLKQMPRIKNNWEYSARDSKIYQKQREFIRQHKGEKMTVRVNKTKFYAFYPKGLKNGIIILYQEFNQWDFREKPVQILPAPFRENGRYDFFWYWYRFDPVNINYGMYIST